MHSPDQVLPVTLNGPGWQVDLEVAAPDGEGKRVEFDVPVAKGRHAERRPLHAHVRYTEAVNIRGGGWRRWHVKVYRCATNGDAQALRRYLAQQSSYIQQANQRLPRASRIPIDPPWSVVPAHIVPCDGSAEDIGPVRTQLAAAPREIDERLRRQLPEWLCEESPPAPERYLLAVSPFMDELDWQPFHAAPATEHLRDFEGMATGLDALHGLGTVHCDIKPDNVCRYDLNDVTGFVLIDTDSVTPVDPPPTSLRPTRPYHHRAIIDWFRNPNLHGLGVDAGVLMAHDRFGFGVVVLTALAGKDWVDRVLLRPPVTGPAPPDDTVRVADDQFAVREALTREWRDTEDRHWRPLIDVLAEPFGPAIQLPGWSAAEWLRRLLDAEARCVVEEVPPPLFARGVPGRYREDLAAIRHESLRVPAIGSELMRLHVYPAIEHAAQDVARRVATRQLLTWMFGVAAVVFIFFFAGLG
jgi:hypothetical protein